MPFLQSLIASPSPPHSGYAIVELAVELFFLLHHHLLLDLLFLSPSPPLVSVVGATPPALSGSWRRVIPSLPQARALAHAHQLSLQPSCLVKDTEATAVPPASELSSSRPCSR